MKFVITETLRSSVIFKTIMVLLHRGRYVVVHLYSTFSVDPQNFLLGSNLYKKITICRDFLSHNGEIWHEGEDLGLPSPSQIL